ncbi:hypothetical protein AB0G87_21485, partial [Streptomyces asoensis]
MTKKTRIRLARIAAGAVIAAGASLTVAGVASADDDALVDTSKIVPMDGEDDCTIVVTPECETGGTGNGGSENGGSENGGSENGGSENGGSENGGSENGGSENG